MDKRLKFIIDLPKADCKVLKTFREDRRKEWDSDELKNKLNVNLTTVQRALKRICDKGLIIKKQKNLTGGGYVFLYKARSKVEEKLVLEHMTTLFKEDVYKVIKKGDY